MTDDGAVWTEVWHNGPTGDFSAVNKAEAFLEDAGFSIGRMQRGDPRGLLFGEYDIQKWRNLSAADRAALHGVMIGQMRDGPIVVTVFACAPAEAIDALTRGDR